MNITLHSILQAHPQPTDADLDIVSEALKSLALCQQVCLVCADACLAESAPEELRSCIRLNLDCAAICSATAGALLRRTEPSMGTLHAQLHACVLACQACADDCSKHAEDHEHCGICAETCRLCQQKCNEALGELSPAGLVATD